MEMILTAAAAAKTALSGMTLSTGLQAAGTAMTAIGGVKAANEQKKLAAYNARQQEEQGKKEYAAATLKADRLAKQKELEISRARAVAAASGGGQDYSLLGDLEEEGFYNTRLAIWEGEEALRGRRNQSAATRYEGKTAASRQMFKTAGRLLTAAPSFYEQYGDREAYT